MSHIHRAGVIAASALATAALGTVGAQAAPVKSPVTAPLKLTCPQPLGKVTIVPPPGMGEWVPGLFVGTHKVLVPYRFIYTFDGVTETVTKKAPMPAGSMTCTFGGTFVDENGATVTFSGSATGPLRGKP